MSRRSSRNSKYHQQYLNFLRKWKGFVRARQYQACEDLCLDHINRITQTITFQRQQNRQATYAQQNADPLFADIKNLRSKVRNLYAVLLHDYLKRHKDALEQYEYCTADDPYNASAHYNWAILYKNYYKDYKEAEVHYKKAIELKPRHAAYHNNYGLLLEQQLKNYNEARKKFARALELDPSNGRAHTNMANLLKKHYKDYEGAAVHYRKAIELDPENPTRHFNYALFLKHNLRQYETAGDEYERAIELDPNYEQAHTEFKNFLLNESPFNRKHARDKPPPRLNRGGSQDANEIDAALLASHAARCARYVVKLLWLKKSKDAKEVLNMALKCNPRNRFAAFLHDPMAEDVEYQDIDPAALLADLDSQEQVLMSKTQEISRLQKQLGSFGTRLSSISTAIKTQGSQWSVTDLDDLHAEMQDEIRRLAEMNDISDYGGDPSAQQRGAESGGGSHGPANDYYYDNNRTLPGSASEGGGILGRRGGGRKQNQRIFPSASHIQIPSYRDKKRTSSIGGKRQSISSVTSFDYTNRVMDVHRQTLVSAAASIEQLAKTTDMGTAQKLDDVLHMLHGTMRALEYLDMGPNMSRGGGNSPVPAIRGAMPQPPNLGIEETLTIGGMSCVSQTATAAMDQRRRFLDEAARNPEVRPEDRAVSKWLTHTYLKRNDNTPRSMLSQHVLPMFSDDDEDTSEDDNNVAGKPRRERRNGGHTNKKSSDRIGSRKSESSQREIRVEERVKKCFLHPTVDRKLERVCEWDFDCFGMATICGNYTMPTIFIALCRHDGLIEELDLNETIICSFFLQVSQQYKDNPYHNHIHGCDVLVNTHYFMKAHVFDDFRPLDRFACLAAAACHDVGHPGNNNPFEIALETELATTYNDISVLENMHVATASRTLKQQGCNILEGMSGSDRKSFRKTMIDAILATDMSKHMDQQEILAELIDGISNAGIDIEAWAGPREHDDDLDSQDSAGHMAQSASKDGLDAPNKPHSRAASGASVTMSIFDDKIKLAQVLVPLTVHTADLSNPTKPREVYTQWADRVMEEFWTQGDQEREKSIPITKICDRHITDLPTCQTGFINHVIRPWFDLWGKLLVEKTQGIQFMDNVQDNFLFMNNELLKKQTAAQEEAVKEIGSTAEAEPPVESAAEPQQQEAVGSGGGGGGTGAAATGTGTGGPPDGGAIIMDDNEEDLDGSMVPRTVSFQEDDDGNIESRAETPKYGRSQSSKNVHRGGSTQAAMQRSTSTQNVDPHKSRLNMPPSARTNKAVSIVAMSFEDIAKVQMQSHLERLEELRKQQSQLDENMEVDGADLSSLRYSPQIGPPNTYHNPPNYALPNNPPNYDDPPNQSNGQTKYYTRDGGQQHSGGAAEVDDDPNDARLAQKRSSFPRPGMANIPEGNIL